MATKILIIALFKTLHKINITFDYSFKWSEKAC